MAQQTATLLPKLSFVVQHRSVSALKWTCKFKYILYITTDVKYKCMENEMQMAKSKCAWVFFKLLWTLLLCGKSSKFSLRWQHSHSDTRQSRYLCGRMLHIPCVWWFTLRPINLTTRKKIQQWNVATRFMFVYLVLDLAQFGNRW